MKKLSKILLIILCFFMTFNFVLAEEEEEPTVEHNDVVPNTDERVQRQKEAITNYCTQGSKVEGCLYDKNNEAYTKIKAGKKVFIIPPIVDGRPYTGSFETPDITLLRGYQAFDGNGKAIYAACYRYDHKNYNSEERTSLGNGSYFFFHFIRENNKNQCVKEEYVVPARGTTTYTYSLNLNPFGGNFAGYDEHESYVYNGKEMIDGWGLYAEFNDWVATNGGECPKVFGYTANTHWYTMGSNRYIFSDDVQGFKIDTISFWHLEEYKSRPGCTVQDASGEQVNKELLLNEIQKEINNYSCPSEISKMNELSNELSSYYQTLRNDNKFRVLWSHDLAEEVIKESEAQINKFIKNKLTECQYKICNVTDAEKTKINQNLGETCKLGCSISNYNKPSNEAGAQCYCCGGSQGCTYKWMKSSEGSQCALQKDVPMGLCIGTTKDAECRSCLINAYDKAGLDDTKSKCLMDSEILKNLTEADLKELNDQAADDALEEEMEENEKIRDNVFANLIKQPNLEIYDGTKSCKELLGPGLTKVLNFAINAVRIVGVIATIVVSMMKLIPAVSKGDQSELQKAAKSCMWSAILLILIVMMPTLLKVIGKLFGLDTSCIN